jgi:hypothetical protein
MGIATMAKRPKKKPAKTPATSPARNVRAIVLTIRGNDEWRDWLNEGADFLA